MTVINLSPSLQKIETFQELHDEIALMRITVPLGMFILDCKELNEELAQRAKKMREQLVSFEVDENRELNRR